VLVRYPAALPAEIGELASKISAHSKVRQELVKLQKDIIAMGGVILEGRDTTTVVAPNADLKIYLTASLEERARRRSEDFADQGMSAEFENIRSQISSRDHRDITREESPLKVAPDAILLESGGLSIEEVVQRVKALAIKKQHGINAPAG
jgi:cytidylate kinase